MKGRFIVAALAACVCVTVSGATGTAQPAAPPVRIDGCRHWFESKDGIDSYNTVASIDFTNTSTTPVYVVRFRIDIVDEFGEHKYTEYVTDQGKFSPGVPIQKRRWQWINIGLDYGRDRCSVDSVRFASGMIWRASDQPNESATEPPAPPPAALRHPATCRVKLADGSTISIPWENKGCDRARKAWEATHRDDAAGKPLPMASFFPEPTPSPHHG